jgi:hypothetical protein
VVFQRQGLPVEIVKSISWDKIITILTIKRNEENLFLHTSTSVPSALLISNVNDWLYRFNKTDSFVLFLSKTLPLAVVTAEGYASGIQAISLLKDSPLFMQ